MVFLYSSWMRLPLTTRAILSKQFGFAKTGPTHVADNQIVQDGYKLQDVEHALNSDETDMEALWKMMIDKAEGRVAVAEEVVAMAKEIVAEALVEVLAEKIIEESIMETSPSEPKKKRGRPFKVVKHGHEKGK